MLKKNRLAGAVTRCLQTKKESKEGDIGTTEGCVVREWCGYR